MKTKEADPVIAEIRAIRHQISARFGHDAHRLVEYYVQKREQHRDQLPSAGVADQETVGLTKTD